MPTGSIAPNTVTLDRDARLYRESFTRCRRDVSSPQRDAHIRNVIKRIECGRIQLAEHQLIVAWDAFTRGAPQADVESPGHTYVGIVRAWYDAERRGEPVDLPALIRGVLEAQGVATVAEFAVLADRSPKVIGDARDAVAQVEARLEPVRDALMHLECARQREAA